MAVMTFFGSSVVDDDNRIMYVYIYVYICIYMYIHLYIYIYICRCSAGTRGAVMTFFVCKAARAVGLEWPGQQGFLQFVLFGCRCKALNTIPAPDPNSCSGSWRPAGGLVGEPQVLGTQKAHKHKHFITGISLAYWASFRGGLYGISLSLFLLTCLLGALK